MGRFFRLLSILWLAGSGPVSALTVFVTDDDGKPVADAVVTVETLQPPANAAARPPPPSIKVIDQKDETFIPYVMLFRPGDSVVFHNNDITKHHVYSFSPLKTFEFILSPGESSSPLRLDVPGIIAVGCNIHDHMIAHLFVSNAPWTGKTDQDGRVDFSALAAGPYQVNVWHPQLHPAEPSASRVLSAEAEGSGEAKFTLRLLPDPRIRHTHEFGRY